MNHRMGLAVVVTAVIAAAAGCGSQVQSGGAAPHGTGQAAAPSPQCPEGSPYRPGVHGEVDYIDAIWHDSVNYECLPSVRVTSAQLGPVAARIRCSMATADDTHAPPQHWADDTATALPAGTPVYTVKGFSPRCRLAAYVAGTPHAYLAMQETAGHPVPRPCGMKA
jgi:hypothetical protein